MDCTELIEAFLAAKHHAFSPNTRRAYYYDLTACVRLLPTIPVTSITVSHLRLFLDATADLAPTTLARRKAVLRSCFSWAYQQELLPADPTAKLEAIPIGERHPRPLTEKQVEAILAAIPRQGLRNRLLLTLLYETGMRVGEALGLQVQQVHLNDLDGGYLRIVGKGNKERVIPLIDASHSVALLRKVLKTLGGVGPLFRGDVRKSMSTSPSLSTGCATPMQPSNCVMGSVYRRYASCWGTPTCRRLCATPRSTWRRSSANWWKRVNGSDEGRISYDNRDPRRSAIPDLATRLVV